MGKQFQIAAISGSLRKYSYNSGLLRAVVELAPTELEFNIQGISEIPPYSTDVQDRGLPRAVQVLIDNVRHADAVLIATPEYNYSIPGVLKNAIDWISRAEDQPFDGKAIAIMGASRGRLGTARAQYHLRQVFVYLNGMVMNRPEVFVGAAHEKHDQYGNLVDALTREFIAEFLDSMLSWVTYVNGKSNLLIR